MTEFEKHFYPFHEKLNGTETVAVPVAMLKDVEKWLIETAKMMDRRYDVVVHPFRGRMPAWMACKHDAVALANAVRWQYDKEWRKTCSTNTNANVDTSSTTSVQAQKQLGLVGAQIAGKKQAEVAKA